jgi:putative ABC transport system permease protein
MMGVDDATLVGAPRNMVLGSAEDLRRPDAVIVDRVGYEFFFPNQPYELGKTLELNDHRVNIAGIYNSSAPFQNLPVFYARYSNAIPYVGRERNLLSFVLAKAAPGISDAEAAGESKRPPACMPPPRANLAGRPSGTTSLTPEFPSTSASRSGSRWWSAPSSPARPSTSSRSRT